MSFTHRAARGAARFDELRPGWAEDIDLSTVDVRSLSLCPGGQVFGSYGATLKALGIRDGDQNAIVELGLDVHESEGTRRGYAALSAAWRGEIEWRVSRR